MMTSEVAGTPSSCVAHQAASDWVLDAPLIVWLALNSQEREAVIIPPPQPHYPSSNGSGRDCMRDPKSRLHMFTWTVDVH